MLLDEPTAGMSVDETQRTAELVLDLARRIAIVVIEHDMAFVRAARLPHAGDAPGQDHRRRRLRGDRERLSSCATSIWGGD